MCAISRRKFLAAMPGAVAAPALLARLTDQPIFITLVYAPEFGTALKAAALAAAEAARAAGLLKRELVFNAVTDQQWPDSVRNRTLLIRATRAPVTTNNDLPIIDVVQAAPVACGAGSNVFYAVPSRTERLAALRAAKLPAQPDAVDERCVAWHPALERFGAAQLNARFDAAGIALVDERTWLAWFAVKCLWEAALRGKRLQDATFDGHKGQALYFSRATQRLVQPLYVLNQRRDQVAFEWRPASEAEETSCAR